MHFHPLHSRRRPAAQRLHLETLETRDVPSFGVPVNYALGGGTSGGGVVTADFNGDGRADIAVHRTVGGNAVSVSLGNGEGTFQAPRSSAAGTSWGGPGSLASGDFNGDGRLDLATANDVGTLSVLLGNGDGTFAAPRTLVLASIGLSVMAGDFNGDGRLDLAAGTSFGSPDTGESTLDLFLGNGDGTFGSRTSHVLPGGDYGREPYSVQAADFNGDGRLDAVTTNFDNTLTVLLGNGDGTLGAPALFSAGAGPMMTIAVAVADLNGDGKPDLAAADYNGYAGTVSVLLGDGTGGFAAASTYMVGENPSSIAAADINGDGRRDLITTCSDGTVKVLLGNGNGTFQVAMNYYAGGSPAGGAPYAVAVGAFNGDALPDLVAVRTGTNAANFSVLLNDGNWSPTRSPQMSIGDVTRLEGKRGQTTFAFTVILEFASAQPVTVQYRTVNGTATASSGDYAAKTGTLTFLPGETSKTLTIFVNGDSRREADETFYVDLFGISSNSRLSKSRGVGTILNDD